MIKLRKSEQRGKADYGWLKTYYTFSFAEYFDRTHMNFRSLRVINEDRVAAGKGFDTHPHKDMEILTYIVEGELAHKDSMGNGRTIRTGELQAMSAGSGVQHSEFNPSSTTPVHLLQIWIMPNEKNLTPSYAEWKPPQKLPSDKLTLLASPDAREGSVLIHQDASLFLGKPGASQSISYPVNQERHLWLQLIQGELSVLGETLSAGDGAAISEESEVTIHTKSDSTFLLFDLQ